MLLLCIFLRQSDLFFSCYSVYHSSAKLVKLYMMSKAQIPYYFINVKR